MKYLFIISTVFLFSCTSSLEDDVAIDEKNANTTILEEMDEVNEEQSIATLPTVINSLHNAKFQVVEIKDSTYIKVILLDIVNREDFEEVEDAVLKTRDKFGLFKGIESSGKLFFKFYSSKEHYDTDALPAIASTYYNNLNGKTGMDIYWGRSTDITKIIITPVRTVIQK